MTFAEEIDKVADGEPIVGAVIGEMGWHNHGADDRHAPGLARKGELLTWGEARPLLDYEYDAGYGSPDCQAVYAWTESRVLFITQYDGSTFVDSMPRNPIVVMPDMPGG